MTKRVVEHILEGMGVCVCVCVYTVALNKGMHVPLHNFFTDPVPPASSPAQHILEDMDRMFNNQEM